MAVLLLTAATALAQTPTVSTWHNDNLRDGQNTHETILTTSNVNSTKFGKLFSYTVDGQIDAQPLYIPKVSISGGTHNVIYVATENDSVYAFDADGLSTTSLWHTSLLLNGGVAAPCVNLAGCAISPVVGITGTPVVNLSSNTLYVVALDEEGTSNIYRLHALDITTGAEKFGGPVAIQASVAGTGAGSVGGVVTFTPTQQLQRPGLLLLNGSIFIGFGSFGDRDPYHGWVMAYSGTSLAQVSVFNTSPNGTRAAVWGAGGGLSADSTGNLYVQTANGTFDASTGGLDYGDSFLKMNPNNLTVLDYFTPENQATLESDDLDLGSGTGLIPPKQSGSFPDEIVSAGKQGLIYVVDRDAMGGYDPNGNHDIQTVTGNAGGYISSPACWHGAIYYSGSGGFLSLYSLKGGILSANPLSKAPASFMAGSTPSVSSNGPMNGIVWAIDGDGGHGKHPAVLHAYDATRVSTELYNSSQAGIRDTAGAGIHFTVPTIANGKVYIGTFTELDVYGLL